MPPVTDEAIENLGPLRALVGVWEGDKGRDHSPSDEPETDRQPVDSDFRERMSFEPIGRVDNHEQVLYALKYATEAFRHWDSEERRQRGVPHHLDPEEWRLDRERLLAIARTRPLQFRPVLCDEKPWNATTAQASVPPVKNGANRKGFR